MNCPLCNATKSPAFGFNPRPMVFDFMYAVIYECRCGSTLASVIWERPEELDLVDGLLSPVSHERDSREGEAA